MLFPHFHRFYRLYLITIPIKSVAKIRGLLPSFANRSSRTRLRASAAVQALVLVDDGRDAGDVEVFSLGLVHAEHLKCRACIAGINFLHVWIFSKISSSFSLWMF